MKTNDAPTERGQALLLVWAIVATFVGLISSVLALYLFIQNGHRANATTSSSPFIGLREESVPGRYRWIENGQDRGVMTLLPDHSFIGYGGRKTRDHRWEIARDALLVIWANDTDRFTQIESLGVYVSSQSGGRVVRIEKIP
jgi:hypothetical protein